MFTKGTNMTEKTTKGTGRGVYTAKPVSVTFPAGFPNEKLAGKTMTYAGRGRKPTWWEIAVEAGLIATETEEAPAAPAANAGATADAQA
jgi:DNA-binding protein H-NS